MIYKFLLQIIRNSLYSIVIPAKAGIQLCGEDPRFRGDDSYAHMLSVLQIAILKECYENRGKINRKVFLRLYRDKPTKTTPVKIITQSLDRLIHRGLIIGYCVHKSDKCFIESIRITTHGRHLYKDWWDRRQTKLPF